MEEKDFLSKFIEEVDIPGIITDGIKKTAGEYIQNRISYHKWERIYVNAGQAVAGFEHDGTEESQVRNILFCEKNMKKLAKKMWDADYFAFEKILKENMHSVLEESSMSAGNQENCLEHFVQIVIGDIRKCMPQRIERSLWMDTRENTLQILDNQKRQFTENEELRYLLSDIRNRMQETEDQRQEAKDQGQEYQRSSNRQNVVFGTVEGIAEEDEWHLASMQDGGFSEDPAIQKKVALEAINLWREEREAYPGWYVAPYKICQKIWGRTRGYEYLVGIGMLSLEEAFALCYEFVWRCETGKICYSACLQKNVYAIWEQYQACIDREKGYRTEQWFYIGTILLREYREEGRYTEWENVFKCLRSYQEIPLCGKEILDVEEIKCAFSRFQISKVRRLCDRTRLPREAYALRLQVIGVQAECGGTEAALRQVRQLEMDLEAECVSEDAKRRIFANSLQVVLFHMEALLQQGIAFVSREYEKYQEPINEILNRAERRKRYFDWDGLHACVESALLKWHVKEYEESSPFDLERESISLSDYGNGCEESYYLYRVVDAMAIPLISDCVNLLGSLERVWFEALQGLQPQLALFMMLRGSKSDTAKYCYNRSRLMQMRQETITSQICFLRDVLLENREEMAEFTSLYSGGVCRQLRSNLPEIMTRCMSRCPDEMQCEILTMLKCVMETPGLNLGQNMGQFIRGMMRQVSEKNKMKMLGELLETDIVEHKDVHEEAADLFDFYFRKEHLEHYAEFCTVKPETILWLLSDNGDSLYEWRTKIARLLVVRSTGALTGEQETALTRKIWSRLGDNKLPDLPNYYLWNFMELDYGDSAVPAVSIKACYLKNGMMAAFGNEEGCKITMGDIRYLEELRLASRHLEKDFWTLDEVCRIYQDAISYWQILEDRIEKNVNDLRIGEYQDRARKMFRTIAEVYRSISGELPEDVRRQVGKVLEEARGFEIDVYDLKVLFLVEEDKPGFAEAVTEGLYSDEVHTVIDALHAAYTFMEKYPGEGLSEELLCEILHMLRSGKQPGLVSAIIILHNLLYRKSPVFTGDKVREADRFLISLEKRTRYDKNMGSESQIKKAALIRQVCVDLAYEISLQEGGAGYPGVLHWQKACREDEFTEVRNEMLI